VVSNIASIKGGQQDDKFTLAKGASLSGTLDGHLGTNTLDYAGLHPDRIIAGTAYSGPVTADLSVAATQQKATGIKNLAAGGIKNIQNIFGGRRDDEIRGSSVAQQLTGGKGADRIWGNDGDDTIDGGAADDQLYGGLGADTIEGGKGDDLIEGGPGNDTLTGGSGDDTYVFAYNTQTGVTWGVDTITDTGGGDTLDFSQVHANLTFHLRANNDVTSPGVTVDGPAGNRVQGGAGIGVKNMEGLSGGLGQNTFKVCGSWFINTDAPKRFAIDDIPITDPNTNGATLDCSEVPNTVNLSFTISPTDSSHPLAMNKVVVSDGSRKITVYNVRNVIGGKGDNAYAFEKGGSLPGQLNVGTLTSPTIHGNYTIDYSKYETQADLNLGSQQQTVRAQTTVEQVQTGVKAVDTVRRVTLDPAVTGGTFRLILGPRTSEPISWRASSTSGYDSLQAILQRLPEYRNATVAGPTAPPAGSVGGPWDITFPVTMDHPFLPPALKIDTSGLRQDTNVVIQPGNPTTTLYHTATEGTFKLMIGGNLAPSSTGEGFAFNAKASDIAAGLNAACPTANVTVLGKGTKEDPWVVNFSNGTYSAISAPAEHSQLKMPFDETAVPAKVTTTNPGVIPVRSVLRVWNNASGGSVRVAQVSQAAGNFQQKVWLEGNVEGGSFRLGYQGRLTKEIDFNGVNPSLMAGEIQSALRKLRGVKNVSVTGLGTAANPWLVVFPTSADPDAQEDVSLLIGHASGLLSKTAQVPANTIPGVAGGLTGPVEHVTKIVGSKGAEYLFAPTTRVLALDGGGGNDRLVGGSQKDELVGGDGSDQITGGAADDTLSGGSGADRILGDAGKDTLNGDGDDDDIYGGTEDDTISGGSGADRLYGEAGNDTLNGGSGRDLLYGAEGNDTLSGGSGEDAYVFTNNFGHDSVMESRDWLFMPSKISRSRHKAVKGNTLDFSQVSEPMSYVLSDGRLVTGTAPSVTVQPVTAGSLVQQRITHTNSATHPVGFFTLSYQGKTTGWIPLGQADVNVATTIKTELEELPNIAAGAVTVTGSGPWTVAFDTAKMQGIGELTAATYAFSLEFPQENLTGWTASSGYVRVPLLGFAPGQQGSGTETVLAGQTATQTEIDKASASTKAAFSVNVNGRSQGTQTWQATNWCSTSAPWTRS